MTGDFEAEWNVVSGASTYSVIMQYPSGEDESQNPYCRNRGGEGAGEFAGWFWREDILANIIW